MDSVQAGQKNRLWLEKLRLHPLFSRRWDIVSMILFLAGPVLSYVMVEMLNHNAPWKYFSGLQIAMNLCWYYIVFALIYLIVGRRKLSSGIAASLFYLIGTANHYVYAFRGRTIFPGDLLTLQTAYNVSGSYNYMPDKTQIITFLFLLGYLLLLIFTPRKKGRVKIPIISTIIASMAATTYILTFFCTSFLSNAGIEPSMWTTRGNGFILNFMVSLRYSHGEKPENYSGDTVTALSQNVVVPAPGDGVTPDNLIVIMNESFSDLEVLGDFPSNADAMPFLRQLTENTVKGYAYTSVFGGTTANSEYEFLTGNTTAFLPAGTVPFQLYIDETSTSVVGQMDDLGYHKVAMHPYLPSGWNRPAVYKHLGFDEVYFKDDFQNRRFMRNYVTDRCNFENVIRIYEEKQQDKLFIFNVTMQNHSAYDVPYRGLPKTTWLTDTYQDLYPTVDQYLSLIRETDAAFEYLIQYFSQVSEPTMILMFGDHQPKVSQDFYEAVFGTKLSEADTDTLQKRQMVPFVIWTNYDIPEKDNVSLSLNYLSTLLMQEANLPLTGYQSFLSQLYTELPVVNTVGYYTADGACYAKESELPPEVLEKVNAYRILSYANIFDPTSAPKDFFQLSSKGKE